MKERPDERERVEATKEVTQQSAEHADNELTNELLSRISLTLKFILAAVCFLAGCVLGKN